MNNKLSERKRLWGVAKELRGGFAWAKSRYNARTMQRENILIGFGIACVLFAGCTPKVEPTAFVSVMIDNHEDARAYQRGLEQAVLVQEQLVEGFITRFEAVFDIHKLPESIGPVRSVRPYFIDGMSPLVPAIFHIGGSPEALQKLAEGNKMTSFNGLSYLDDKYTYDDEAPAPHHRFLERASLLSMVDTLTPQEPILLPFTYTKKYTPEEKAQTIDINYYSPLHNVRYTYDPETESYNKESGGEARPPSPKNLLILETDVEVIGPYGRLAVRMTGEGDAKLFRNGGMTNARWEKSGDASWFTFKTLSGETLPFHSGQIWMIVLDSLERVSAE